MRLDRLAQARRARPIKLRKLVKVPWHRRLLFTASLNASALEGKLGGVGFSVLLKASRTRPRRLLLEHCYVRIHMCGRKLLIEDPARLSEIYGVVESTAETFVPSYNLAPTAREPIVRLNRESSRVLTLAVWDYGKASTRKRPPFFNARSETFTSGEAFAKRRCLVPVNGFYEWAVVNGRKQPFVFVREDREVFSMGGCWTEWHGPDGAADLTYVELTTEPNALVGEIHKRMPLIINRVDEAAYLEGSLVQAQELARPNPMGGFIRFAVGPAVNSTRKDAPELIMPAGNVDAEGILFS